MQKKKILIISIILILGFSFTVAYQVEGNAVTYDTLREPLKQLYNLNLKADSISNEVWGDNIYEKRDKLAAIFRQMLKIARELQKIIPDAVKITEGPFNIQSSWGTPKTYSIKILREEMEKSLGKMPKDIEKLFPTLNHREFYLHEDENFSYVGWVRKQREKVADDVTYDTIREHLKQLYNLYLQLDKRLKAWVDAVYATDVARKKLYEKRDELAETCRKILKIAKELQKIVPNAVEVIRIVANALEVYNYWDENHYSIIISSQELEEVFGKMPKDIEKLFPTLKKKSFNLHKNENFSYVKWWTQKKKRERKFKRGARTRVVFTYYVKKGKLYATQSKHCNANV